MSAITCNTINSSINAYTPSGAKPWNVQRIRHLYNRLGFGASRPDIQAALTKTPGQLVDELIDGAIASFQNYGSYQTFHTQLSGDGSFDGNYHAFRACGGHFSRQAIENSVRAKMVLFWSGHLVVDNDVGDMPLFDYYYLLHQHAFGNFKDFVIEMGLSHAMLQYLGATFSQGSNPNENYSRELLELFLMGFEDKNGNDNYDQNDVVQVARVITGWWVHSDLNRNWAFNPKCHDWGSKTMMTTTQGGAGFTITPNPPSTPPAGACHLFNNGTAEADREVGHPIYNLGNIPFMTAAYQEYVDLHDQLFTVRADQIAWFICKKIYQYFVSNDTENNGADTFIDALAQTFKNANWEIAPVLRQLFKSEHFFEETHIGVRIKNPWEFFTAVPNQGNITDSSSLNVYGLSAGARAVGQTFLNPPDVSGWDGYRTWITQYSLVTRWGQYSNIIGSFNSTIIENFRQLAEDLTLAANNNDINALKSPQLIVEALIPHFFSVELQPAQIGKAVGALRGTLPPSYYEEGYWGLNFYPGAEGQIIDLILFFTRQPEFNLC